ncbi:hypothetical protein V8C26DRAFT_156087 [Trichoderma gracile]
MISFRFVAFCFPMQLVSYYSHTVCPFPPDSPRPLLNVTHPSHEKMPTHRLLAAVNTLHTHTKTHSSGSIAARNRRKKRNQTKRNKTPAGLPESLDKQQLMPRDAVSTKLQCQRKGGTSRFGGNEQDSSFR